MKNQSNEKQFKRGYVPQQHVDDGSMANQREPSSAPYTKRLGKPEKSRKK
jgi:hypothetical protein